MELVIITLIGIVVTALLSGTLILSHTLKGELSHLRGELSSLRSKYEDLRLENESLKRELKRIEESIGRVNELEEVVKVLIEKRDVKESGSTKKVERDPMLDLKILSLHRKGYSIRKIAEIVGLSKSTVHRIIKKALEK